MNKNSVYNFFSLAFFLALAPSLAPLICGCGVALAQVRGAATTKGAPTTFGHIRRLSLPQVRDLALERAPAIAQAKAKIEAARAEERQLKKRIVPQFGGGIDPFSGQVRYYMNLDLQRLFQLNKAERDKAKRTVEAEQAGQTDAQNGAIASVTTAWFGLQRAEAGHKTARRNLITAKAIFVSADARFRAGTGELGSVLGAMNGQASSEDAVTATRQSLLLACLTLAQACGYPTAEEMEAALDGSGKRFGALPDDALAEEDDVEEDAVSPGAPDRGATEADNSAPTGNEEAPAPDNSVPF